MWGGSSQLDASVVFLNSEVVRREKRNLACGRYTSRIQRLTKAINDYFGNLPQHMFHCSVLGREALTDTIEKYREKH